MGFRASLDTRPDPRTRERWTAITLFLATAACLFFSHLVWWQRRPIVDWGDSLQEAALFSAALLLILLSHESGHYFVARRHGFRLTLPLFIPMPYLGTLGAVIALRERPNNRVGLAEMGVAGPLSGLLVIAAVVGLSQWVGESGHSSGDAVFSTPLLFWVMGLAGGGASVSVEAAGTPLALAAWLGCLVTAFNLLPYGQLDGGHLSAALSPGSTSFIGRLVFLSLLLGGVLWVGWWLWAGLLAVAVSTRPVEVRDTEPPPSPKRLRLSMALAILTMALVFHPIPFQKLPGAIELLGHLGL